MSTFGGTVPVQSLKLLFFINWFIRASTKLLRKLFLNYFALNQGDSGGPMVCYNADGSGYLGGIVR